MNRQASLGYQVNYLARLLAHALRDRIEKFGVVPGQFAQLLALYEQEGQTQRELCERVCIEQPTMANTLKRMERDGLIERVADPRDARRSRVMLTDEAKRKENDLTGAAKEVNGIATKGIDEEELSAFMTTLARIIRNLEGDGGQPTS